ncbi:MAG: tRNA pseudouridine(55) synthase TruB [Oscillospiraceae bacterium]|jgi:tRNA pseudouridine synthase B|nr:tRNA pseudouridine(55) synthase TruB [Oscillospiraceae bacterium]
MNGIILIDKPQGWTSHDVVGKLRGILHERRIGHSGTLDPLATGLLVVFVGRATRAVEFAETDRKEYIAGLRLGISTDTQDITGRIINEGTDLPDEMELRKALERFKGELEQIPPMYSAVKVGGKKLYELARKGESIERKPRHITVFGLETAGREYNDYILNVVCSKGTYIRTLCHDIGTALGCGGCMSSLRRTKSGVFSVEDAYTITEVQEAADRGEADKLLLPADTLFAGYPELRADAASEKLLRNGCIVNASAPDGRFRVYSEKGEFLLLSDVKNGRMKTVKSFFEV